MKSLFILGLVILGVYGFFTNTEFRNTVIASAEQIKNQSVTSSNPTPSNDVKISEDFNLEKASVGRSEETIEYFKEVAYGTEFNGGNEVSRWNSDMKIFVSGDKKDFLMSELNNIVSELNNIINPIEIYVVDRIEDANYVIYFCDGKTYADIEPAVRPYINSNWGMFAVSGGKVITDGTMYVDVTKCPTINSQKHLLREELTQSLGLKRDSYRYENSIFYQVWSETTEYSPIDIELIEMLYNY